MPLGGLCFGGCCQPPPSECEVGIGGGATKQVPCWLKLTLGTVTRTACQCQHCSRFTGRELYFGPLTAATFPETGHNWPGKLCNSDNDEFNLCLATTSEGSATSKPMKVRLFQVGADWILSLSAISGFGTVSGFGTDYSWRLNLGTTLPGTPQDWVGKVLAYTAGASPIDLANQATNCTWPDFTITEIGLEEATRPVAWPLDANCDNGYDLRFYGCFAGPLEENEAIDVDMQAKYVTAETVSLDLDLSWSQLQIKCNSTDAPVDDTFDCSTFTGEFALNRMGAEIDSDLATGGNIVTPGDLCLHYRYDFGTIEATGCAESDSTDCWLDLWINKGGAPFTDFPQLAGNANVAVRLKYFTTLWYWQGHVPYDSCGKVDPNDLVGLTLDFMGVGYNSSPFNSQEILRGPTCYIGTHLTVIWCLGHTFVANTASTPPGRQCPHSAKPDWGDEPGPSISVTGVTLYP